MDPFSDEGMDPCECLWNHELNMRRLLSLLRQGQSYCTDTECLEEIPGVPGSSAGNSFLMMFMMMALAVAMYMLRPRRNQLQEAAKPAPDSHNDNGGAPPAPPRI